VVKFYWSINYFDLINVTFYSTEYCNSAKLPLSRFGHDNAKIVTILYVHKVEPEFLNYIET
jgi:hypothetical protein